MSGIMDMFKSVVSPSTGAQAPANQGVPPVNSNGTGTMPGSPNTVIPGIEQAVKAPLAENPLDIYQKVIDNARKAEPNKAPEFAIDGKVLEDVSSKMDFTRGVNPELLQKAMGGDAASMLEVIQQSGRAAYKASMEHNSTLTNAHLAQRLEFESKRINSGVKEQLTSDALKSADNANFNHPVVQAELNRVANLFAQSAEYADASPAQVAKAAKDYLNSIYSAMNPAAPKDESNRGGDTKEMDYLQFLTK